MGSGHAVERLLGTLEAAPEPIVVIALAPLSNLAMAIRMQPTLCRRKIRRVVWMGGAAFAGGNFSAWAEANAVRVRAVSAVLAHYRWLVAKRNNEITGRGPLSAGPRPGGLPRRADF